VHCACSIDGKRKALEIRIIEFASPLEQAHRDEKESIGKLWAAQSRHAATIHYPRQEV
jgi:hypothetical protein